MFYLMRKKRYKELILTLDNLHKTMVELRAVLDGLETIVQLSEENRRHLIIKDNQNVVSLSKSPCSHR